MKVFNAKNVNQKAPALVEGGQAKTQLDYARSSAQKGAFQRSDEQRIDWFQLIQEEKTAMGSKQLNEHFMRGMPLIEASDKPRDGKAAQAAANRQLIRVKD